MGPRVKEKLSGLFQGDSVVPKRNLLEKWGTLRGQAELVLSLWRVVYCVDVIG